MATRKTFCIGLFSAYLPVSIPPSSSHCSITSIHMSQVCMSQSLFLIPSYPLSILLPIALFLSFWMHFPLRLQLFHITFSLFLSLSLSHSPSVCLTLFILSHTSAPPEKHQTCMCKIL